MLRASLAPLAFLAACAVLVGCEVAPDAPAVARGPLASRVAHLARERGVPSDLALAVASIEGGLMLPAVRDVADDELVPIAGVFELRHGRFDSLARGASILGVTELELQKDLDLGTEAGVAVLAELAHGAKSDDLSAWADAIETLSGHGDRRAREDYRARVFALLRFGGEARARGGERVVIPPHDEIPIALTLAPPAETTQGTPDFAGAQWFDTPSANKWMPGRDAPISMIAIHDTEGGWDASVATLQNDPGKSVHYIIDADGSRFGQFVHESDTAWHVGNSYYNHRMIGIEHVGYAGMDDYKTSLYEASGKLVRDIAHRNKLGANKDGTHLDRSVLVGHQEVPNGNAILSSSPPCPSSPGKCVKDDNYGGANNHRDPGIYWEWCQYLEIIGEGAQCKCNDAFELFNCVHDLSEMVRCNAGKIEITHCPGGCVVMANGVSDQCAPDPATSTSTSVSVGVATGTSSSSSSSSGAGGSGGGASDTPAAAKSGCGCRVAGDDDRGAIALGLGLMLTALARRRRSA
jgi:MYXO-CTERM domain-containing protein